jgi:ABC-type nitrate/sulfonate/bicarbonate transport system substrate-binding protein
MGMASRRGLTLAVLLGGLLAAGGARAQPAPLTVAIGGPASDLAYLPVHAAVALGTLTAEGVEVTLKRAKHPAGAMTAVRDREAGIAVTTLDEAIRGAWARNFPVQVLAAHVRAPTAALLVAPAARDAVRRVEDLRGRAVGIPGPGTTGHLLFVTLLRGAKLQPWQVDTRSLGTSATMAALGAGDIAAAVVEEPWVTRLLEANRADVLVDLRTPEAAERALGGAFYEVVSVVAAPVNAEEPPKKGAAAKKAPPPIEPPPEKALVAFTRALARVQVWLATAEPGAIAERLPSALVGDRRRFEARLRAQRAAYAGTGEPTPAGLEASLRVLRAGSPWPVTLKVGPEDLAPPPAVAEARGALGAAPPAP